MSLEGTREKYITDYRDELLEKYPIMAERQMDKILKNMAAVLSSYLGNGLRGFYTNSPEATNSLERCQSLLMFTKVKGKEKKVGLSFKYKAILKRRELKEKMDKINTVTLEIIKKEPVAVEALTTIK